MSTALHRPSRTSNLWARYHLSHSLQRSGNDPHRQRGFTLIDLMICVAVIGVLSTVAYPAFSSTVSKSRRSDALVALMKLQLAQERHRADHPSYADLTELGQPDRTPSGHYQLNLQGVTAEGYTVHATAIGAQQGDVLCRHLRLSLIGAKVTYESGDTAALGNAPSVNRRCWSF